MSKGCGNCEDRLSLGEPCFSCRGPYTGYSGWYPANPAPLPTDVLHLEEVDIHTGFVECRYIVPVERAEEFARGLK